MTSTSCSNPKPSYKERRETVARSFCVRFEQCTTAKYDTCMKSIQNAKVQDEEKELQELIEFNNRANCQDFWRLVYQYQKK